MPSLPSFINFSEPKRQFDFAPTSVKNDTGIFEIEVSLDDRFSMPSMYHFLLTVGKPVEVK
jgi:hypothetical protein